MDFLEVIKKRHCVRAFEDKDVEEEKLKQVLEVANLAPSAGNLQAYEIFVIRDQAMKEKLVSAALGQSFIAQAPVVLVFMANPDRSGVKYGQRGEDLYCIQDATIAASYAFLAVIDHGMGAAWVGAFNDEAVKQAVEAELDLRPIVIMPIGYAGEEPEDSPRRELGDLTHNV